MVWIRMRIMCAFMLIFLALVSRSGAQNVHTPYFLSQPTTVNVTELASLGDDVFTCRAADDDAVPPESAALEFSIVGGSGANHFEVDNATCEVTVSQNLDYEATPQYDVIIQISDLDPSDPKTATTTFVVDVTDANEYKPELHDWPSSPLQVSEDTGVNTQIFTMSATDQDSSSKPSGQLNYTIIAGNTDGIFDLDPSTGVVKLQQALDYESRQQHVLTLRVSDLDLNNQKYVEDTLTIYVTDVNEFTPELHDWPSSPLEVSEDTVVNTQIFTVSATDQDSSSEPSGQLNYTIIAGNMDGIFDLDSSTGVLKLQQALDYESRQQHVLTMRVSDLDPDNPKYVDDTLTVDVTDVNEFTPELHDWPGSSLQVSEDTGVNMQIFTVSATDQDSSSEPSGQLNYTIIAGNMDGIFDLDPSTGVVKLQQALDYESRQQHVLTLRVSDLDPDNPKYVDDTLTIDVTDVNEFTPELHDWPSSPLEVSEDTGVNIQIFTVSATDQDSSSEPSGQLNYTIVAGNADGLFDLDPSTGVVKLQQALDYESRQQHVLTLRVSDLDPDNPKYVEDTLTVDVTNVNEFTPELHDWPSSPLEVSEDTGVNTQIFTVSATDQDSSSEPSGQLNYTIIAGNTDGLFDLDSSTGVLKLLQALDYESRQQHVLTLRVSDLDPDNQKYVDDTLTIDVTDVNEFTPELHDWPSSPLEVSEDTGVNIQIFTVSATDHDSSSEPSGQLNYTIVAGNVDGIFDLDPSTGVVKLQQALDYESRQQHVLTLRVSDLDPDNPKYVEDTLTIDVTNVNEFTPELHDWPSSPVEVSEDTGVNTQIFNVSATDQDSSSEPSGQLNYTIIAGNTDGIFDLDPSTGVLRVQQALDYESRQQHVLTLRVSDLDSDNPKYVDDTLAIDVTDVNEFTPELHDWPSSPLEVSEDTDVNTQIFTVSATDQDSSLEPSGQLNYTILAGNVDGIFDLDPSTGVLKLQQALDYESRQQHVLTLRVSDLDPDNPKYVDDTLTIDVTDVNEFTPELHDWPSSPVEVSEDTGVNTQIFTVSATDQDSSSEPSGQLNYAIIVGNADGIFDLDPSTGVVKLQQTLDYESRQQHVLTLRVSDLDPNNPKYVEDTLTIDVGDVNEFTPELHGWPSSPLEVSESTDLTTPVFAVSATDGDSSSSLTGQLNYTIMAGNADGLFDLDPSTGVMKLKTALDYESRQQHVLTLRVTDLDPDNPKYVEDTLTIHVKDVNEFTPEFIGWPSSPMQLSENTDLNVPLLTISGSDGDSNTSPSGQLSYTLSDGNTDGIFVLDPSTGVLKLLQALDYESRQQHVLTLRVSDLDPDNPRYVEDTLTINVTDVNEFTPSFVNLPALPMTLSEDTAKGNPVFKCSVSDGDSDLALSGQHAFSIIAGNDRGKFSLDNSTCQLTLVAAIDFEKQDEYNLEIEVSDLDPVSPRKSSMVFTIKVEDINEKPTMEPLPVDPLLVYENVTAGTVIFTCSAVDPDLPSLPRGQLTYNITEGNERGIFAVNPNTCEVYLDNPLDFESVDSYQLTLRARDQDPVDRKSVARPLTISVLDVNEHTPEFANVEVAPILIGEHSPIGSTVFTCTGSDDDSPTQPSGQMAYEITGGNADGHFTMVDDSVCEVTLVKTLDFETQSSFPLTLTVHDLDTQVTFSSTQLFQVTVVDENDKPDLQNTTSMPEVLENSPADTPLFDCVAIDQDDSSLPSGQLSYAILSGNTDNAFVLTPPCSIKTSKPLDHEQQVLYDLEIEVTDLDPADPQTDVLVYTVKVKDINDNTPYFVDDPEMPIKVPEDTPVGASFMNCSGEDDDTPLELTGQVGYEIVAGNEDNMFSVNETTGDVSLLKPLDYESNELSFTFTVRLFDLDPVAPRHVERHYRFCVTNVNDNRPTWVRELPTRITLKENWPLGIFLGSCQATDDDTDTHPSGHVRYKIKSGNGFALFYLNPYTCDLYVNGLIDYEQKSRHTLKVVAFDLDEANSLESEVTTVSVRVLDVNDMGPSCQTEVMEIEVPESQSIKTTMATMNCDDVDSGRNGKLSFEAISDSDVLQVEATNGNIKLLTKQDWDDASMSREHQLVVQVKDRGKPPNIASSTVSVIITDVDDIKPLFVRQDYQAEIYETVPRGTTVITVSAFDGDEPNTTNSAVTYDLLSPTNPDWFLVNPYTGAIVVKHELDREEDASVVVKMFAYSSNETTRKDKTFPNIRLLEVNDNAPSFSKGVYWVNVRENKVYSDPVVTVRATDKDKSNGGTVRFRIEDGWPLEVDKVSGEVRLRTPLDFEGQRLYFVPVVAHDLAADPLTSTALIVVNVHKSENEFSPVHEGELTFSVDEDTAPGTVVHQLSASDQDSGLNGEVDFASPISPDQPFYVDQSGRVILASKLDFETAAQHSVPVVISDRSQKLYTIRSTSVTLLVTVNDVNDLGPVCQPIPAAVAMFPWTGFPIASLNCHQDVDTVNGNLSYSLVGGDPDGVFVVDADTGDIKATAKPSADMYELKVKVSDGGVPVMTSEISVVILLEPELKLNNVPSDVDVTEDAPVGTLVLTAQACCSFTPLKFEIVSGNDVGLFHLHAVSGALSVHKTLDRETAARHEIGVRVKDERGQNDTATIVVNVQDVNDNGPVFNPVVSMVRVGELQPVGSTLGQWTAVDTDEGLNATLTYGLLDTLGGRFSVDTADGTIRLEKALDFEMEQSFTLVLIASDGGAPPFSATVTIQGQVLNADEHMPQFLNSSFNVTLREDSPLGVALFVLVAQDFDLPDVIRYELSDLDSPFRVIPDTGEVVLLFSLDREAVTVHSLHFKALNDHGHVASQTVTVEVEDVNDNDPVFSKTVYVFQIPHSTNADVTIGQVSVTDDDTGVNADVIVDIVSGNGLAYFVMDGDWVKTAKTLLYNHVKEFVLTLRAYNVGTASDSFRYAEATVRIEVLPDVDAPKFGNASLTFDLEENTDLHTLLYDLDATLYGATEGSSGTVQYSIRSGNAGSLFSVNVHSGELLVAAEIDYDLGPKTHTLVVEARNRDDPVAKDSVTVVINVLDLNDNAPEPDSVIHYFSVDEDAAVNTSLGRVVFTDKDSGVFGEFSVSISGCSKFKVDSETGEVSVSQPLSYHQDQRSLCLVTAEDGGDPSKSGVATVSVTLNDLNDHTPQFQGAPYEYDVYENLPPSTILAVVLAVDRDAGGNGELLYSLLSGDPSGTFGLNETTGHLTLTKGLDATVTPKFELVVKAADSGNPPLTSQASVVINVIDVNDHVPQFSVASLDVAVDRVAVPGTLLTVVSAVDDDLDENAATTFTITEGNADGLFALDSSGGQLTSQASLLDAADTVKLTISATDHGKPPLSSTLTVNIFVSPPLSDPQDVQLLTATVSEAANVDTFVTTIHPYPASEADLYVIVSGNFQDSFKVELLANGTGELRTAKPLDAETYRTFNLLVAVRTDGGPEIPVLIKVDVTDVNDNAPDILDGFSLNLTVPENSPAGLRLWSLSVRDSDVGQGNGTLSFDLQSVSRDGLLKVTPDGHIELLGVPDYEAVQTVQAVVMVTDNGIPPLSSSIAVTLRIKDVDERQFVETVSAATTYISTEVPYNTKKGQLIFRLSASDFSLETTPSSVVTFLTLDVKDAFAVDEVTGTVTVKSPELLVDNSVYFKWVVCTVVESDGSSASDMALVRIDTYDKYKHLVAIQYAMDVATLEENRDAILLNIQSRFGGSHRAGIHSFIAEGGTARRRLLAVNSLALVYVVEDRFVDQLDNLMATKTFLTQDQILQDLRLSSDGTPVGPLASHPDVPAVLVMPYHKGQAEEISLTESDKLPIIIALACFLLILVIIFIVCCVVNRSKKRRKWKLYGKGKKRGDLTPVTPAPGFFVRKDSLYPDDVSMDSYTSLRDDDSGVGESFGSKSPPRKSLSPSTGSENSGSMEIGPNGMALSGTGGTWSTSGNRPAQHTRYKWKTKQARGPYSCALPKPPTHWLPNLPDHKASNHRGSVDSWFESPYGSSRLNCRGSLPNVHDHSSDPRRGSGFGRGEEGTPNLSRRRSSINDSKDGRPPWRATTQYPEFGPVLNMHGSVEGLSSHSSANGAKPGVTMSWVRTTENTPTNMDRVKLKEDTFGHQVTWKPKRNVPKKIFHEKLQWNAVSTIPKATPLPCRRREANRPVEGKNPFELKNSGPAEDPFLNNKNALQRNGPFQSKDSLWSKDPSQPNASGQAKDLSQPRYSFRAKDLFQSKGSEGAKDTDQGKGLGDLSWLQDSSRQYKPAYSSVAASMAQGKNPTTSSAEQEARASDTLTGF